VRRLRTEEFGKVIWAEAQIIAMELDKSLIAEVE
jgi:hypothetical protein